MSSEYKRPVAVVMDHVSELHSSLGVTNHKMWNVSYESS